MELKPYVSVIIPAKNEGILLKNTVDSFFSIKTTYTVEIVIVDDGSTDDCAEFIHNYPEKDKIKLIKAEGLGSAMARNLGAESASGDFFIFCDAHLAFEDFWVENLLNPILSGEADAVNPGIADSTNPDSIGFGYSWNHNLEPKWNADKHKPFFSPLLAGGCLAISKKVFFDVDGFEKSFKVWGREDEEFSIKLWLFGYRCIVLPSVKIQHYFRPSNPPFKITWDDVDWNFLRMAYSHFSEERIVKCKSLIKYSNPTEIEEKLLKGDILEQRERYRKRRKFDDNWFMEKFNIPF
ncbi:glycosyltransferase [Lysinibacillus antri]|uniref:Glycosyltransferase n=1 Tax=Lysinibacillus antri TaxID=2498145 RepID=A0A3S0P438_9BACI|nr:glycosyltransferase [Lysinibacillus antri]RUL48672.1 glycosyltransferase [Lysinibacillus antri]